MVPKLIAIVQLRSWPLYFWLNMRPLEMSHALGPNYSPKWNFFFKNRLLQNNKIGLYILHGERTIHQCCQLYQKLPQVSRCLDTRAKTKICHKSVKFHHGNEKSHIAKVIKTYLEDARVWIIRHPPYSSYLALCDFWLFDLIKRHLTGAVDAKGLKVKLQRLSKIFQRTSTWRHLTNNWSECKCA